MRRVLWISLSTGRRTVAVRCGHLGAPTSIRGLRAVTIDRLVPIRGEKELRAPVCELDKKPAR